MGIMDYTKKQKTAIRLITKYGASALLIDSSAAEHPIKAVKLPPNAGVTTASTGNSYVLEDSTQAIDVARILITPEVRPQRGDIIRVGNEDYDIDSFGDLSPDFSITIFYDCICNGS